MRTNRGLVRNTYRVQKEFFRMYKVKDHVFHKRCGICLIEDIAPLSGAEQSELYYVLSPIYGDDRTNIVRVPVTNTASLSVPPSKGEVEGLVSKMPRCDEDLYVVDSKKRKLAYDSALTKGSLFEMAPLLQGAMQRKKRDGHLNSMDAQFVARAEPIVLGVFSYALGIEYDAVKQYLSDHAGYPRQ